MILMEREILRGFIKENNLKTIFEMGTFRGETSNYISPVVDKVYTLDNKIYPEREELKDNVTAFIHDSLTFDYSTYSHMIDMVFIDCNHNPRYLRSDTRNAWYMCKPGGWICWHDYDISRFHVIRFVNRYDKKKHTKIYHPCGTKLAFMPVKK